MESIKAGKRKRALSSAGVISTLKYHRQEIPLQERDIEQIGMGE